MVWFRGYRSLSLVIVLALSLAGAAAAEERVPGLYDRPVLTLDPGVHTAAIRRADVDAAGTIVVTGSYDKTVRIWSARTGGFLRTIRLPRGPGNVGKINAVAISPNGELVAAGGWTRISERDRQEQIYLFDLKTGVLVHRIEGLSDVVFHLVFSPDGRYLAATLGGANGLRVYDRDADWDEIARDDNYGDSSYGATFAADGRLATTSDDGYLRLYDRAFRRVAITRSEDRARPYGIAFNPEGARLAIGYADSTAVSLFDGRDLTPLAGPDTRGLDNGNFYAVAWSADGATLYAGGRYDRAGISLVVAWSDVGVGTRRELAAGHNTIMSLQPLPKGGLLVGAGEPYLAVLDADGTPRWEQRPQQADLRDQERTLSVSADGGVVDFGYEAWGKAPARFDLARLALSLDPPEDDLTAPPKQATLKVENWVHSYRPTLNGKPLPLDPYEISRSLAIHPDGKFFVLGADWQLRAFDAKGEALWQRSVPGVVWAVNITADGRLVVAAYGDGTIRWHRMDDGRELLALFPMADRRNWVAWTPEGVYAATAGAHGVLRWHVNRGWDQAGEAIPVSEIPETRRPEVIRLVLQEMGTPAAIAVAELAKIRAAIQRRTGTAAAPGARLHVLTVGVSEYGEAAKHLRLSFADKDANDVAAALLNTQTSLYAGVLPQRLSNKDATKGGILRGLATMREAMAKSEPGRDLAVFHFSGHGALVDGEFYLLTHDVDVGDGVSITSTALPASMLRRQLEGLGQYGRVLVLLDACRSGGAMANGEALTVDAAHLRTALVGPNITVLTSSTSDQLSREDAGWGNGAFTEIFLEALSSRADVNKNGLISVSELTGYLTRHVPGLTKGAQRPGVEVRFDGDVFVASL
jgi:WD40 repeat protein